MDLERIKQIFAETPNAIDEDGDFPESWYTKICSYKRFRRNHVLMRKILNEEMVGDVSDIPSEAQRKYMKKQMDGLLAHKAKLDKDIVLMEEKHKDLKNHILELSESFNTLYDSIQNAKPPIDEEYVEYMTEKYYQDMKRQQAENKVRANYVRYRPYEIGMQFGGLGADMNLNAE